MKIKCPFCKNIYDPEACDNTCPACSKKLMVSVFKKKPEGKPGAIPATTIRPPTTITPKPVAPPPPPPPPPPAPVPPAAKPVPEFVAPKAPVITPVIKPQPVAPPPAPKAATTVVTPEAVVHSPVPTEVVAAPAPAPAPVKKMTKVVVAHEPAAPTPPPPPPAEHAHEKKHAHHGQAKAGLDLVISIGRSEATDWDAVIRVPVQVFKFANLIPARAREAITSEGIDFEELRKATEHADHVGPLLDIQTKTERVHIALEPHG